MTVRYLNPFYVDPVQAQAEALQPAVEAWLRTQSTNKVISLSELRAALPSIAAQLDRKTVNHLASMLGMQCINPEDPQA